MEYSPLMIVMLWALTPSDCKSLGADNSSQEATVKEIPRPSMTIQNPSEFRVPGYFTFNNGQPFLVEKDPLTGAIDLNFKTTPINTRYSPNDYYYEEEDYDKDEIDRKDGDIGGTKLYTHNDIKDPVKNDADLHKFLNLPVHYSSSGKFPLISSSYANTKVQGHGSSSSSYSNHKPYTSTPSTVSPSYYPLRTSTTNQPSTSQSTVQPTTTKVSRPAPTTVKTTTTTTTTITTTTTPKTTTTTTSTMKPPPPPPPASNQYEYEYIDYDYDRIYPETSPTTQKTTTTTTRPTTKMAHSSPQPFSLSTTKKPPVSIVTSAPIATEPSTPIIKTTTQKKPTNMPTKITNTHGIVDYELLEEGPFRPMFGSENGNKSEEKMTDYVDEQKITPPKPTAKPIDFTLSQNKTFTNASPKNESTTQQPTTPVRTNPSLRPNPSISPDSYLPSVTYRPGHGKPPHYPGPLINRPESQPRPPNQNRPLGIEVVSHTQDLRPPPPHNYQPNPSSQVFIPPDYLQAPSGDRNVLVSFGGGSRQPPSQINEMEAPEIVSRPVPSSNPSITADSSNLVSFSVQPDRRPQISFVDPPRQTIPISPPQKGNSHFIQVSPGQDNPSYALQTSFSIGVPPPDKIQPGKGVGTVLFPDDTNEETETKRPQWTTPRPYIQPHSPLPPAQKPPHYQQHRPPLPPQQAPNPGRLPNERFPPSNDKYPRPQWESHLRPPQFFNPLAKKDVVPQVFPPKRGKPQNNHQRPDLPNILPQFRPNAKIGVGDYHNYFNSGPPMLKPREPYDTLQPPPLPPQPRPQFLRLNRDELENDPPLEPKQTTLPPLVHRRTGTQANSRISGGPIALPFVQPKRPLLRADLEGPQDRGEPVFLVYPSNGNAPPAPSNEGVIVVGTRGPHKPLPPDNLDLHDEMDNFPLDDNKHFPMHTRDRIDTPILKKKPTPKPVIKNDFPYALVKPTDVIEERISTGPTHEKEYNSFNPTSASNGDEIKDHDAEINLIPYLQDYMPFATKKPSTVKPVEAPIWNVDNPMKAKPISVVLNTKLASTEKTEPLKTEHKVFSLPSRHESIMDNESNSSEFTVSASMHTNHHLKIQNHKPFDSSLETDTPKPQDFQAPFHASLSAPSQGWSVVPPKNARPVEKEKEKPEEPQPHQESKFDIDSFKPQLFGGFQPILPPQIEPTKGPEKKPEV